MGLLGSNLAKSLKFERDARGLSQGAFADLLGVSRASVNRIEVAQDAGTCSLDDVESFAEKLRRHAPELLGELPDPKIELPSEIRRAIREELRANDRGHDAAEYDGPHPELRSLLLAELDALSALDEEQADLLLTAIEEVRRMRPTLHGSQLTKKLQKPKR